MHAELIFPVPPINKIFNVVPFCWSEFLWTFYEESEFEQGSTPAADRVTISGPPDHDCPGIRSDIKFNRSGTIICKLTLT